MPNTSIADISLYEAIKAIRIGEEGYQVQESEDDIVEDTLNYINRLYALSTANFNKYLKGGIDIDLIKLLPLEFYNLANAFSKKEANTLLLNCLDINLEINFIENAKLPFSRPYPIGTRELEVVQKYINNLKKRRVIRESRSPCASPILLIKKLEGGIRVYINYCTINAITIKNQYPILYICKTLARIGKAKFFIVLDVISAFNRLRVKIGDKQKTAFTTRYSTYKYLVVPFGLYNASSAFQSYINKVLQEYIDDFCSVYIDNIITYSETRKEYVLYVRKILEALCAAKLPIDIKKSKFFA